MNYTKRDGLLYDKMRKQMIRKNDSKTAVLKNKKEKRKEDAYDNKRNGRKAPGLFGAGIM